MEKGRKRKIGAAEVIQTECGRAEPSLNKLSEDVLFSLCLLQALNIPA